MRVSKNWVKFNKMFTLSPWCLMQVVTINAWNRIAVATRMEHDHS